jgi:crossover junction endodeoxyribonuclease RuvC
MDLGGRIRGIVDGLFAWADPYINTPKAIVAIEDNHFTSGKSAQSALKQREVIGALAYRAACCGIPVVRVAPTAAKKALTGSGKASKQDMVDKANEMLWMMDLSQKAQEAIADALGVCLAAVKEG